MAQMNLTGFILLNQRLLNLINYRLRILCVNLVDLIQEYKLT